MTDKEPTKREVDVFEMLKNTPVADDLTNSNDPNMRLQNDNLPPLPDDVQPPMQGQGADNGDKKPPTPNEVFSAILNAHAKPDFKAAQEAERSEGEGLDLGICFFRRRQETAEYNYCDDHGNEGGERLLFKKITYVAARTGGGKTRFMCALAAQALYQFENAATPKHVFFFSLEEPAKDITKHIVTAFINLKHADIKGAAPITENDTINALLNKQIDGDKSDDKRNRIEKGYSTLADLLTVIDYESFEAASEEAAKKDADHADKYKYKHANVAEHIVDFIIAVVEKCRAENVVFFIDYAQMLKDPDGAQSAARYKELQNVTQHLIRAAHKNAVLFVGAQVTRDAVKSARKGEKGEKKPSSPAAPAAREFHRMTREDLREAADLEQSGARIIYLTIDYQNGATDDNPKQPHLNMRLLKNRYGTEYLYAAAPIHFDRWTIDFNLMTAPTLGTDTGDPGKLVGKDDKHVEIEKQTAAAAAGTKPSGEKPPKKFKYKPTKTNYYD